VDIDSKLSVIQEMRREQIRRERESYYPEYRRMPERLRVENEKEGHWFLSFRLRLLIAILLFFCFFLLEQKEIKIGGIGTVEITEYLGENISWEDI